MKPRDHISEGKFIGNPRGNLECGSAQPSSLNSLFVTFNTYSTKAFQSECQHLV
jgi:hypothetical protein